MPKLCIATITKLTFVFPKMSPNYPRASEQGNWRASEASETLVMFMETREIYMYLLHTSAAHCAFFNDA